MSSIDKNWVDTHVDSSGEVVIPEGVEKIEAFAFAKNEKVKRVIMPDSVTEIGDQAFTSCPNLEEVKFSKNIKKIGAEAFRRCQHLSSIELPKELETLGTYAFSKCSQLSSVIFGNNLKEIEEGAFFGCALEQIRLPDSLEKIDAGAFLNCTQLTTVEGGTNITDIKAVAFKNTAISSFQIPKNITSLEATTFGSNPNLSSITLNENLDFLSEKTFDRCENLEEIIVNGTPRINYGAFMDKPSVRKITIDGKEITLDDDEHLFSLQKSGKKAVIVVQDEKGKCSSKLINLEKNTGKTIGNNAYLTAEGGLCYAINSLADISVEGLKRLGLNQIYIYGGDNEIKPIEHEKGLNFNLYSVSDLIQIKTKIEELKKQIIVPSKQDKHREKKIYSQIIRVLSENIEYDYWGAGVSREKYEKITGKSYDDYIKKNQDRDANTVHLEDRNLVGLIRGTAVCQGNTEIIRNIAAEYGIEAISIRGKNHEGEGHEWNQVKLDGVWYDDDFTYYQTQLANGNFDRCDAFLMGTEGNIPYTQYAGYKAYTQTHPVGKPYSRADKKFLLNYGRVQQQAKQQSVQPPEKERPPEKTIKDEVGDEFKSKTQEQKQREQEATTEWMNRIGTVAQEVDKTNAGVNGKQEVAQLIKDLDKKQQKEQNKEQEEQQDF